MASNAEMRRLVLHAADRLVESSPADALVNTIGRSVGLSNHSKLIQEGLEIASAIALAEQTLRMVAACLADDEPDAAPDQTAQLRRLVAELVDTDPCSFDHAGGCQAHGFLSLEPGQMCPHEEAKRLLDASGPGATT